MRRLNQALETQWKTSWKHSRVWKPMFETISNMDANFLILHIDRQQKHVAINNFIDFI